jgi:hypothetical protein
MITYPSRTTSTLALCLAIASGGSLAATSPDPGDYTALPAGTDLLLVYGQQIKADKIYAKGQEVLGNADLTVNVGLLRWVHFTKWMGYTVDPQVILPLGSQKLGLTGDKASGLGDVIFGGTLWTIADQASGENLGWSAFVTAPTGADKDKGYALSDDRWALDLQVGYIRKLAPSWTLDVVGQTELYQDRRDNHSSKDPMVRGFAHLRYHLNEASHLALSYRHTLGARVTLDGTELSGRKNDGNVTLTWASFLTKQVQLQLQASQDVKVENGPKTTTLGVRALYAF